MVTCLSEIPHRETCYHFALIFAKLFTAAWFSRKDRNRKTLPLSTIFAPSRENRQFHPFGRNWRLRWKIFIFSNRENHDFSRFSRYPATSRGFFTAFAKKTFLTTSSGVPKYPTTAAKKKKEKLYSEEFFSPKKFSTTVRYRSKNWPQTELKPPQKCLFLIIFETKKIN